MRAAFPGLLVEGDLDGRSGPLDTEQGVHITGSVRADLALRTAGDLEVEGQVEAGARIEAGGQVKVRGGILGRDTRIVAHGGVRAGRIEAAEVVARGDVVVAGYVRHARVRASGGVVVEQGGLLGGEIRAVTHVAIGGAVGAPSGEGTLIDIVADPEAAARLAKVEEGLQLCERDIGRILRALGAAAVRAGEIEAAVGRLSAGKRKFAIEILKQLQQLMQLREQLLSKRQVYQQHGAQTLSQARVSAAGRVFQGTCIRLGGRRLDLSAPLDAPVFYLTEEGIRW
ncbi:MAG: DUF342 domain-containing protein [Candidatus Latescibacteria bacterium]|nr:DUF342 domain-containing protein [Candidatus Latescibacterota bacterium]